MPWRITDQSLMPLLLLAALLIGAPFASLAEMDGSSEESPDTNSTIVQEDVGIVNYSENGSEPSPYLLGVLNFNKSKKLLFVLGTDFNEISLKKAASHPSIASELNVTIFTRNDTLPDEMSFSDYAVVFMESQDEAVVNGWNASINDSKLIGVRFIGYNLSSNITAPNVDLSSANYTDIERYWVQGGDGNMENMLRFVGQKFCGSWADETVSEPLLLRSKIGITYITNSQTNIYYLNKVLSERGVIKDLFNVTVMDGMDGEEVAAKLSNLSDQDVVILHMIGYIELSKFKDILLNAKAAGTQIGLNSTSDAYGISTIDLSGPPYNEINNYIYRDGYANMENFLRFIGAKNEDVYIEYKLAAAPSIPDHGIYHPDAFPRIFKDSAEYLEWYADNGYDETAPTIGIIATNNIVKDPLFATADDVIIRNLESKGCNVIYTTYKVCADDVDYFTRNGKVLVDCIISLKGFGLNYGDQEKGVEYLKKYDVPVLKAVQDPSQTPSQFNESARGLGMIMISFQVIQPEIDGCTDYIWVSGYVKDPATEQDYYEPLMPQVNWLCDRAISWANLGRCNNADKKVSIIYYNHEGGKNDIGASYLDISSSFTLLLERMRTDGYDIGNGSIPNGSELIDLFIESRNVGTWAPGELEKVVNSGNVTLVSVDDYLFWYNTLPNSTRSDVEATWGKAPGDIMVYEGSFVIPTVQFGKVNFIPQPSKAWLSDESLIYHNKSIPPTHQYLATYFWINNVYDADAIIHFGTHGTQEWFPGKEVGLSRYDYSAILVNDTPVIYPYIMDNVGEGTQAKRRGNAVIIDHLTPPIIEAGIYGDLAAMHEKIHNYGDAKVANDSAMMALYRNSIIGLYENLSMENDLGVTPDELRALQDDEFGNFIGNNVHNYLHKLQSTLMPYGVHIFGLGPKDEKLVSMVKSMLRSDFVYHIYDAIPQDDGDEEDWRDAANAYAIELLNATLLDGKNVSAAQLDVLNLTNADENITADLHLALEYSNQLGQTTREIDQTMRALDAEYIEPGPGNDPIRNPEALPTGRNFYSFDQRKFPDEETTIMGEILANQLIEDYINNNNGTYPEKVSYTLWAMETMRHHGLMEAQIHALLGAKPIRSNGVITDFEVVPQEEMNHPRIDVIIQSSGLYRDTFPYQLELIDKAIRTAAELNETNETNYVRWNSMKMEHALIASGYNNSTAHYISRSRIFSEAPGAYGNGMPEAIAASDTWDNESKLADLFISRTSHIYGKDMWGDCYEDVFTMNLMDVDAAIHSDSTNLFGIIDGDDYYGYLGGIELAVRSLTGKEPAMYIASLESVDNPQIITLNEAFRTELRSRYFNPRWITGMMECDYAGARQFMKFAEYMWGWEVTTPDMVTDSDWDEIYDIYVNDKYDLGLDEFLKTENPYQYQSITARMIEAARKEHWGASDEVLKSLAEEYTESVAENDVTCCHHTCGNLLLKEYMKGIISGTEPEKSNPSSRSGSGSSSHPYVQGKTTFGTSNQTQLASVGTSIPEDPDPVEEKTESTSEDVSGFVMENAKENGSMPSISGAPLIGIALVLFILVVIGVGFKRR
ncbi:MAG: cobaltochelatase subunit CobN [Methanotrichaceae archaeon]|nr:cobaltochelatase subunit CobN [Methanotrichaceae archaeon]